MRALSELSAAGEGPSRNRNPPRYFPSFFFLFGGANNSLLGLGAVNSPVCAREETKSGELLLCHIGFFAMLEKEA